MPKHIRVNGLTIDISAPLTLTAMQVTVGGFIWFVDLPSGDLMVINEASRDSIGIYNPTASKLANQPVYGDVIVCESGDVA